MQPRIETKLEQSGAPATVNTVGKSGPVNEEIDAMKDGLSSDKQATAPLTYPVPVPGIGSQTYTHPVIQLGCLISCYVEYDSVHGVKFRTDDGTGSWTPGLILC